MSGLDSLREVLVELVRETVRDELRRLLGGGSSDAAAQWPGRAGPPAVGREARAEAEGVAAARPRAAPGRAGPGDPGCGRPTPSGRAPGLAVPGRGLR